MLAMEDPLAASRGRQSKDQSNECVGRAHMRRDQAVLENQNVPIPSSSVLEAYTNYGSALVFAVDLPSSEFL